MERETPEERLAAWETLVAIAFPPPYELPYVPPSLPVDGKKLSKCDRVRRDTYNMVSDFINSRCWEIQDGKDRKKVAAGRLGASVRHWKIGSSDSSSAVEKKTESPKQECPTSSSAPTTITPADNIAEDDDWYIPSIRQSKKEVSERDRKRIDEWHKKIPNAAALKEWLERNYLFQNKKLVCSKDFCEFAYNQLAVERNWTSSKTGHALTTIQNAIHWMAINFMKMENHIKRAEKEEHRKVLESEFATKVSDVSQMSSEEIEELEHRRRRMAEKEAMDKILKGEL